VFALKLPKHLAGPLLLADVCALLHRRIQPKSSVPGTFEARFTRPQEVSGNHAEALHRSRSSRSACLTAHGGP
jgi:hypothetical protein